MGYMIDDKKFINENIFKFEKRLESQYTIFTDKTPTFVTYYHINNTNSMADNGFQNVEKIFGKNSPVRFQEIHDFPIYGIENIKMDLSDEEEGLNGSFEGEGIILPNTIKPLPNDFFTISYLSKVYIFMVTSIDYDTIKSNNYYKINYYLRTDSEETYELAQEQILEKYECVFENIGTDDKCLIKSEEYVILNQLEKIYCSYAEKYNVMFYSGKFNSYLFGCGDNLIYDKYLSHFINKNGLFNEEGEYRTIILTNEDWNDRFIPEYDMSFFTAIEDKRLSDVEHTKCAYPSIAYGDSIFVRYNMNNVLSTLLIDTGNKEYIPDELIDNILHNVDHPNSSIFNNMIVNYFNDGYDSIYNLNLDKLSDYKMRYTYENFLLIPIVLFIMRYYYKKFMIT